MLTDIISDINKHQADYKPETFDGFLFARDGQNLLHLERKGAKKDGRTGFLEYNAYRHEMMEEAKTERIIAEIRAQAEQKKGCVVC